MLYVYHEPENILEFAAYTPPDTPEGPFLWLHCISHFDAVSRYLVVRDGMPELLFAYTVGGEGRLSYKGEDYRLTRGSAFLIDCQEWHTYGTVGRHWDFLWIHLTGETAYSLARYIEKERGVVIQGGAKFAVQWQTVLELAKENDKSYMAAISAALYQLLTLFLMTERHDDRIQRAISCIQEHSGEALSVERLAREACMSPYYFQRRFRQETGMTVHHYLQRQRVSQAKRLLMTTDLPVAKIAEITGFSGSSHFTAIFKSLTGYTPRDYRRL